jgi:alcohol dehydrogenase
LNAPPSKERDVRAVIFEEFGGPLSVRQVPDPTPRADGVVIAVKSTGICRSDWHGWRGHDPDIRVPHVPGHELAGEVVAIGRDVGGLRVGARVTVPFVSGCGGCSPCQRGDPQVCDVQFQPGFTHWGSFAEYVGLHYAERNVVELPEGLSFERAASLGCRFTTAYRALVQLAQLRADESLVVLGCGGVGLSSILIARALGARAIAVDVDPQKLELAREVGADVCIDATGGHDVARQVIELTRGGADVSIDALGSAATLRQSLEALRKRGRHVQVGLLVGEKDPPAVPMSRVIGYELQLFGSHGIAARAYPEVFDLIDRKMIPLDRILGPRLRLEDVPVELPRIGQFQGLGIALVDPQRV